MPARMTMTAALAMLACPATLCAAPAAPPEPTGLIRADLALPKHRALDDDSRWLLPHLTDSYEPRDTKPRLRIKGKKIKWWMPLG